MEEKKVTLTELLNSRRKELNAFTIEIDADPASKSLGELYRQRSKVKAWTERAVSILNEAIRLKRRYERDYDILSYTYENDINFLLINDEEVKKQSTKEARQAAAANKKLDDGQKLFDAQQRKLTIESYNLEVSNKVRDLYKTLEAIYEQSKSIDTLIYLGEIRRGKSGVSNKLFDKKFEEGLGNDI